MKQLYKSLSTLFVLLIISTFWTSASAVEIDGIYYYLSGSEATVTNKSQNDSGYSGDSYTNAYSGTVIIPSTITYNGKTYRVTSIQKCAFLDCPDLITISIPSTVVDISTDLLSPVWGYYKPPTDNFSGCTSLKAFIVDSQNPNYSAVGGILFDKNKTTLLRCPQTKTGEYTAPSTVKTINSCAFYGCTAITSISLPNSIKSIEYAAFFGCSALTSINIPTSLTKLGGFAFYNSI